MLFKSFLIEIFRNAGPESPMQYPSAVFPLFCRTSSASAEEGISLNIPGNSRATNWAFFWLFFCAFVLALCMSHVHGLDIVS